MVAKVVAYSAIVSACEKGQQWVTASQMLDVLGIALGSDSIVYYSMLTVVTLYYTVLYYIILSSALVPLQAWLRGRGP